MNRKILISWIGGRSGESVGATARRASRPRTGRIGLEGPGDWPRPRGPVETVVGRALFGSRSKDVAAGAGRRRHDLPHGADQRVSRCQGRVRRETTRKTPDGQTEHTSHDFGPGGRRQCHELDATNKTAFTRPAHFPSASSSSTPTDSPGTRGATRVMARDAARARRETNVKRETLAARSMNGMIASGTRVTHTIPAGEIGNSQALETVRETWIADDLKVPLMTQDVRSAQRNAARWN